MEAQPREDFVAKLLQLINDRPVSNIVVIVESPIGIEITPSVPSVTMTLGILRAAEIAVEERLRAGFDPAAIMQHEKTMEAKYSIKTEGKAN